MSCEDAELELGSGGEAIPSDYYYVKEVSCRLTIGRTGD